MWGSVEAASQAEGQQVQTLSVHMCLAFSKKREKPSSWKNGGKIDSRK